MFDKKDDGRDKDDYYSQQVTKRTKDWQRDENEKIYGGAWLKILKPGDVDRINRMKKKQHIPRSSNRLNLSSFLRIGKGCLYPFRVDRLVVVESFKGHSLREHSGILLPRRVVAIEFPND